MPSNVFDASLSLKTVISVYLNHKKTRNIVGDFLIAGIDDYAY